ncbi:hypothetical protein J31TS4_10320 [Paenibacillus sp. J31TS4]|uniref:hypothetical protein n=1 Tax=Paenibacillus sp. J31TS4 TaxID=2807195 RepID=UPI001B1B205D|nr:hypothetical protein J31TS4_10320 [Paenibacillus sp. J31TS4]
MKLVLATEDERAYRTRTEELDWDDPDIRDLAARLERVAADETPISGVPIISSVTRFPIPGISRAGV